MSLGGQHERRSLACHKLDGGYEIIPGYSSSTSFLFKSMFVPAKKVDHKNNSK